MKQRWAALMVVLALYAFLPQSAAAQAAPQSSRDQNSGSSLGQNYPNPVRAETTIPFTIGGAPNCEDSGRQYRVSLKIYNMLAQLVALPVLHGGTAGGAGGQPVNSVQLTCGQYSAYWDGRHISNEREVASGVYLYRLDVDGRPLVRKMVVMK